MVIKLTYFPMTGLGEPIRLILCYSKTEFEDIRVNKEEWEKLKPTLKLPHLPMLETEGRTFFQAMAICRHFARKADLSGFNEFEELDIDGTVDTLEDFRRGIVASYYQPDSEHRFDCLNQASEVTIPFYLNIFEKQVKENKGYLVAGKVTWADIVFFSHTDYFSSLLHVDILENFPTLKNLQQRVSKLPRIKRWLEKRPPNPPDCRIFFS